MRNLYFHLTSEEKRASETENKKKEGNNKDYNRC